MKEKQKSSSKSGELESGEWKTKSEVELMFYDRLDEDYEVVYENETELSPEEYLEKLSTLIAANKIRLERPLIVGDRLRINGVCYEYMMRNTGTGWVRIDC